MPYKKPLKESYFHLAFLWEMKAIQESSSKKDLDLLFIQSWHLHLLCFISNAYKQQFRQGLQFFEIISNTSPWIQNLLSNKSPFNTGLDEELWLILKFSLLVFVNLHQIWLMGQPLRIKQLQYCIFIIKLQFRQR